MYSWRGREIQLLGGIIFFLCCISLSLSLSLSLFFFSLSFSLSRRLFIWSKGATK